MPAHFSWQTEEETDWTDELEPVGETVVPLIQRRWLRPLLVTGLLLLLAGLIVAWQINRRAKAVTDAVEADVIASYELLMTAVTQEDVDLFQSLHLRNGRHGSWGRSLDTLAANDSQFLSGYRPGLTPLINGPAVEGITLSPDLKSAELVTVQDYVVQTAKNLTETISLRQVYVYQLQEDGRWLLAAPDDDFWGKWQTYESPRLRLSYPARDEAISLRIAAALD